MKEEQPGYKTMPEYEAQKAIEATVLASDLSHQLEAERLKVENLEAEKRNFRERLTRLEGARDALRELLVEALKRD